MKLYNFLIDNFWIDGTLIGPDPGARFNLRMWRFLKSYLSFVPWTDCYRFMQAQAYWVLANLQMHNLYDDDKFIQTGRKGALGILKQQQPEGYWEYPIPEWSGRIGTIEGNWAAIGLLASHTISPSDELLGGALKWYFYLLDHIGFQESDHGLAINYFAHRSGGIVPNATSLTLTFLGMLTAATGDKQYAKHCSSLIAFLSTVQEQTGEFPYVIDSANGAGRPHYQCYQYQAYQLLDLGIFYQATGDGSILPIISGLAQFLQRGIKSDGRTQFDCADKKVDVLYHTAAVAAALKTAYELGVIGSRGLADQAFDYVLSKQDMNGAFPFSSGDYGVLKDTRHYPRYLAMTLQHLLLRLVPLEIESSIRGGRE